MIGSHVPGDCPICGLGHPASVHDEPVKFVLGPLEKALKEWRHHAIVNRDDMMWSPSEEALLKAINAYFGEK